MALQYIKKETFEEILKELYPKEIFTSRKDIRNKLTNMVEKSQKICKKLKIEYTRIIEVGCLLHDIGRVDGVEFHHITGARRALTYLKQINHIYDFRKIEVIGILDCIKMHRESFKMSALEPHFPLEAQVVNLANRELDVLQSTSKIFDTILLDCIKYMYNKYSNILTSEEISINIYQHIKKKYGYDGYGYSNPLFDRINSDSIKALFKSKLALKRIFELDIQEMYEKYAKIASEVKNK